MIETLIIFIGGFIAGILVGRRNKQGVEKVVASAKKATKKIKR